MSSIFNLDTDVRFHHTIIVPFLPISKGAKNANDKNKVSTRRRRIYQQRRESEK